MYFIKDNHLHFSYEYNYLKFVLELIFSKKRIIIIISLSIGFIQRSLYRLNGCSICLSWKEWLVILVIRRFVFLGEFKWSCCFRPVLFFKFVKDPKFVSKILYFIHNYLSRVIKWCNFYGFFIQICWLDGWICLRIVLSLIFRFSTTKTVLSLWYWRHSTKISLRSIY